jgi:tetratricopeptide (TPR) repeat protein
MTDAMTETTAAEIDLIQPWPGLDAFTEELSRFFYGRDAEADELFRHVQRDVVTVLFGRSGLGKTSLLQAGLFPRLRKVGFLPILVRLDYSAETPSLIAQVKAGIERECSAAKIHEVSWSTAEESLWGCFHRIDRRLADHAGKEIVPVLVFDQFEEIFTRGLAGGHSRAESQRFLTEFAELVENRPPEALERAIEVDPGLVERFLFDRQDYRIVISLREDFLVALDGLRSRAPSLGRNRYRLRRLTGGQALDAILNPVPGLVEYDAAREIIRFVGQASPEDVFANTNAGEAAEGFEVEPSLLSLFCRELNERRLAQGLDEITADLLAGSRDDIIEHFYERCLAGQPAPLRTFVEDKLLSAGSGLRESVTLDTAQRALHDSGIPVDALDELVRRRLLRIEERFGVTRVEIIHDVLTTVIRSSRDRRRLDQAEASAAEREIELRRERRNSHRARLVAVTMGALALVTIGLAFWAWHSSNEADLSRRLAEERTEEVARIQLLAAGAMLQSGRFDQVLDYAIESLQGYRDRLEKLAVQAPNDVGRKRELAVNDFTIGLLKFFSHRSPSLNETLDEFQKYYTVTAQLASLRPVDPRLEHDLAAAHAVLGVIFAARAGSDRQSKDENLGKALSEYRESLTILTRLSASDTSNSNLVWQVAVSHKNIGSLLKEQEYLTAAVDEWRTFESLVNPLVEGQHNANWRSELADLQKQIGDALQATGDLTGAVEEWRLYETALHERLKDNPTEYRDNDELANTHDKIGDALLGTGKNEEAIAVYKEGLAIREKLATAEPEDAQRQEAVVLSLQKIGDAVVTANRREEALAAYRGILAIREKQTMTIRAELAHTPGDAAELSSLLSRLNQVALARQQISDLAGALAADEERVSVARRLYAVPYPNATDNLVNALGSLSHRLLLSHRSKDAAARAEEALRLDPSDLWGEIDLAHAYLFLGRFEDAKNIYLNNKDKPVSEGLSFAQAVKKDFSELRNNGLATPEMLKIEDLLSDGRRDDR